MKQVFMTGLCLYTITGEGVKHDILQNSRETVKGDGAEVVEALLHQSAEH